MIMNFKIISKKQISLILALVMFFTYFMPIASVLAATRTINLSVSFRKDSQKDSSQLGKVQYKVSSEANWHDVQDNAENIAIQAEEGEQLLLKIVPRDDNTVDYAGIELRLDGGNSVGNLSGYGFESDNGYAVPLGVSSVSLDMVEFGIGGNPGPSNPYPDYAEIQFGGNVQAITEGDNLNSVTVTYNDGNTAVVTGTGLITEKSEAFDRPGEYNYYVYAKGNVSIEVLAADGYIAYQIEEEEVTTNIASFTFPNMGPGYNMFIELEFRPVGDEPPVAPNPSPYPELARIQIGGDIVSITEGEDLSTVTVKYNNENKLTVTGEHLNATREGESDNYRYYVYGLGEITFTAVPADGYEADLIEFGSYLYNTTKTYYDLEKYSRFQIDAEFWPEGEPHPGPGPINPYPEYAELQFAGNIQAIIEGSNLDEVTITYNNGNTAVISGSGLIAEMVEIYDRPGEYNYFVYAKGNVSINVYPAQGYIAYRITPEQVDANVTGDSFENLGAGQAFFIEYEFRLEGDEPPVPPNPNNYEDIAFDIAWYNSFVNISINNRGVIEESQQFGQESYIYNDVVVQNAGTTDPNETNVIRLQVRFGDYPVNSYTINGVVYTETSDNVEITVDDAWEITVPGAEKYTISGTGDTTTTMYTINFDLNGGTEGPEEWTVPGMLPAGTQIQVGAPSEEEVIPPTGKEFDKYEVTGASGTAYYYDGDTFTLTENLTIKIIWKDIVTHTVTFDLHGGTMEAPLTQVVRHGKCATKPDETPIREKSYFIGWYELKGDTYYSYDFDTPVTKDITIHAGYEPIFTITFDFNGGTRNGAGSYETESVAILGVMLSTDIFIDNLNGYPVIPPEGKEIEAFEVNGKRLAIGEGFAIDKDITIKYLWKDKDKLSFSDIPEGAWFYDCVKFVSQKGIIKGYNETTFAPFDNIKREQLVTILWRMEGEPDTSALPNDFSDVPDDAWYAAPIKWAKANNIVKGYGGTTKFGVSDNIIRQDLAIMLMNYAKYKGKYVEPTGTLDKFADKGSVSDYAVPALRWASDNGIITGNANSDGTKTIAPLNNAMRCEAAAMIMKFYKNVIEDPV